MNIQDLLKANKELSIAPSAACKLNQLLRVSPFLEEIVRVIQHDPALTARILQVCNTVVFRGHDEVTSLEEATRRLGLQRIMSWVWQLSLGDVMREYLPVYGMKAETFWRHSVITAIAAEELWNLTSKVKEDKSTAFTGGLLHDLGKILINAALQPKPKVLYDYCLQERLSIRDAEKQICGYDHAQIGGELLQFWNLPSNLTSAITYHHNPELNSDSNLSCLLHIADVCSHTLGESHGAHAAVIPVSPYAFEHLDIDPNKIEHVMVNIHQRLEEIEDFVSIRA